MKAFLLAGLFDLLAWLPLRLLHGAGAMLGWITYWASGRYAFRLRENLEKAMNGRPRVEVAGLRSTNIAQMGKAACELPWIWRRPLEQVVRSVRAVKGIEHFEAARRSGKGIIVLTPHLGCFEIVGLYVASQMPMTCMYRVPKQPWLDPIIRGGRERGMMKLARADVGGVRVLLKALKRGEAIGILPDQVPGNGEGEWANFFGRPAYSMTLAGKIIEASGSAVLLSYGERLPRGAGYTIHFRPLELKPGASVTQQLNAAQEQLILECPSQYLWSYNRYKVPAGVQPPGQKEA